MKYIDAEKLKAEIEDKLSYYRQLNRTKKVYDYVICPLEELLEYISSLQQEQPEVDLKKEIWRWMDKLDDKYCMLVEDYSIQDIKDTARHFYELGQRTKYQQDRGEFAKLKAKEWQDGYDEGYAKGLARKEDTK